MRRVAGVLVVLTFLVAACTRPAQDDDGIASAGGGTASVTTTKAAGDWDPVRWARCLREHGITVDDPDTPDGKPRVHDELSTPEELDAAADACRRYNPNWGVTVAPDPEEDER